MRNIRRISSINYLKLDIHDVAHNSENAALLSRIILFTCLHIRKTTVLKLCFVYSILENQDVLDISKIIMIFSYHFSMLTYEILTN